MEIRGKSYIDEIKKLTAQIREQDTKIHSHENFTRSLLESMDDLVFVLNRQGRFVGGYSNPSKGHLYFVPESEFVGKHHNEVMPKRMHLEFNQALEKIKDTLEPQQYEYYLDLEDGRHWFEARLSPLKNTITDFAGLVVVARDITERKQKEIALENAAEAVNTEKLKLESVTESIGAGLIVISTDYKVVWANKIMKSYYGNIVGDSCKYLHGDAGKHCPNEFCPARRIFEDGEDKAIVTLEDDPTWGSITATPLYDQDNEIVGALELITFKSSGDQNGK